MGFFQTVPVRSGDGHLEYILIDILAKRAGMPFHRFLGASKDSVTVYGSGGSAHLSGKALADDHTMEEFLEVCNQPVLDYMEMTMEQKDGRFYLPDIPGLPFKLNVEWLRKKGFLLSYQYISCKYTSFGVQ